ncbi:MAG: CBS domain-containing protein [Proteobacteria bacterium]|nr:CBS domain-containing protein [Pseudomonadota bacterium]
MDKTNRKMISINMIPSKRIKDLMLDLSVLKRVSPQAKVVEAVKLLDERRQSGCLPFLLVVDEVGNKEEILGKLSIDDILAQMEPSTMKMEELPIFWQSQFWEECEDILQKTTDSIMSPVKHVIHQSATLIEAVHLMNSGGVDWLPVVERENVVGILFKEDLFNEVLAAAQPKDDELSDDPS